MNRSTTLCIIRLIIKVYLQLCGQTQFLIRALLAQRIRNAQSDKPNGMVTIIDLLQQAFGKRQNSLYLIQADFLIDRNATSKLCKIIELNLQCKRTTPKLLMMEALYQFDRHMIKFDYHCRMFTDVFLECCLTTHRFSDSYRNDRPFVDTASHIIIKIASFAKLSKKHFFGTIAKLFAIVYTQKMHSFCRHRAHSPKRFQIGRASCRE